jgi:hypothetical protein
MPHFKINIWICLGLALLGYIYPSYPQAPGVRPQPAKPAGKNIKPFAEPFGKEGEFFLRDKTFGKEGEFFLRDKKLEGGESARTKALNLRKESAPPIPYAVTRSRILERYKKDVEFKKRVDQKRAKLIEQGIDQAELTFLLKHSMLDEHSSVQFVANQSDKDIDEFGVYMKKIAKTVLDNAVRNVPLFEFETESACKSALKDAVKKACDELNRAEEPLPWTLKFELESDDLVFQSRDDNLPDAKLSIKTTLSKLTNLANYESI